MKRFVSTLCAATAMAACLMSAAACAAAGYTVFPPVAAFSDDIAFSAHIMGSRAQNAYTRMRETIADINAQVSTTYEGSDLNRFNASSGERVEVGKYCYDLFNLSVGFVELTGGAFDPAMLPLVELWHVDAGSIAELRPGTGSNAPIPPLPSKEEVEETLSYCDISLVTAEAEGGKYYLKKLDSRVKLDFGAVAKGYAVDRCVEILNEYNISSALLDISGNAYFYGDYVAAGSGGEWNVGIASPRPRAGDTLADRGYVCAVSLNGGVSAVTSGDYMRYYVKDGVYVPHIIGRSGAPVGVEYDDGWKNGAEYVISATVIGESSARCDALSTAVAALGIEDGGKLLAETGYKGLIFTEKRYTIINGAELYKPDVYDGFKAFEYYEL